MHRLVSYAETSSDEEDKVATNCSFFPVSGDGPATFQTKQCVQNEQVHILCPMKVFDLFTNHKQDAPREDTLIQDPSHVVTIKENSVVINGDNENHCRLSHSSEACDMTVIPHTNHLKSESIQMSDHKGNDLQIATEASNFPDLVNDHLKPTYKNVLNHQTASHDNCQVQSFHTPLISDRSKLLIEDNIYDKSSSSSNENKAISRSSAESLSSFHSVMSETVTCTSLSRKRKVTDDSSGHLQLPDAIQSMFGNKQNKWTDDPTQHEHRVRSFPHLEGNWATHVYIPVARAEPFVKFVDELLSMLMPPTWQMQPEFHVSLSRTVTIRYHWIELLVESLRENFKSLTSFISDFVSVKLFTNDEKTRTFVVIELSQEDQGEFMNCVKAVDKSFAEFKLPAYYENPSFHISIGWCLGDAVSKTPGEKLLKAQEMLGEFVAAHQDLSFVYARQICCQTGCKSFMITLPDSSS